VQVLSTAYTFGGTQFSPAVGSLASHFLAGETLTNTITDFAGISSVSYKIGGVTLASTTAISFRHPSPANIVGILKTPTVYYSTENDASTVYVIYSVSDAQGRSQCDPTGVSVSLAVGTATNNCIVFSSAAAPYGSCSLTVSPAAFSSSGVSLAVSVSLLVGSVVVQTTPLGTVALAPIPTQSTPVAVGMYLQMPIYVAVPGDTVAVDLWSQTGSSSQTMESWGASLVYDSSWLFFQSVAHPLYTTVLTNTAVLNALNVTGSGGSGGIIGWFLAATLYFDVTPAAAGSTIQMSMPALITNAMVIIASIYLFSDLFVCL
jgi:hypothetical protein